MASPYWARVAGPMPWIWARACGVAGGEGGAQGGGGFLGGGGGGGGGGEKFGGGGGVGGDAAGMVLVATDVAPTELCARYGYELMTVRPDPLGVRVV